MNKLLAAAVFALLLTGQALAAPATSTSLTVTVKDGSGTAIQNADLIVVNYGMNGPTSATQMAQTDVNGQYTFTISTGMGYSLYVDMTGYSPTIRDQFNNPDPSMQHWFWPVDGTPLTANIVLNNDQTNVGKIQLPFTHATPNKVLFGSVNFNGVAVNGFFGMVKADGSGAGTLTVDNVPYAKANTYNIGIYDPDKNRGVNRNVSVDLNSGNPTLAFASADFDNSVPPARVDNNTSQGGGSASSGVAGVIQELNYSTSTIPHMGINFHYCSNYGDSTIWVNTDDNGSFQLNGLTPGVTYYAEAMGGCTWTNNGPGGCFAPYKTDGVPQNICLANPPARGINDFVYQGTSDTQYVIVQLSRMPPSTGQIKVCVKSGGMGIPNSNVNLNPDGSPWPVDGQSCSNQNNYNMFSSTNFAMNPGYSNMNVNTGADGCAALTGLPSGNYMVNIWTPFTGSTNGSPSYNGGADGQFGWGNNQTGMQNVQWSAMHCSGYGADDFRVTVDTKAATMRVYDSSGAAVVDASSVQLSSITYVVTTGGKTNGVVWGTATFPTIVDLRANPILIALYANCSSGQCPPGNFTTLAGNGASSYTYSINVSSGFAYYMNVTSAGWGRINQGGGDNSVDLSLTTSAVVNMNFTPAGTLTGTVYKPDGSVFTPTNNQYIGIDADTNNGWAGAQVQKDGTFTMNNVLPGVNRINLNASGDTSGANVFNYSLPTPSPTANITAGSTTTLNINLVTANNVGIALNLSALPDSTVVMDPSGSDMLLGFKAVPLPAGSVFTADTIVKMLTGGDSDLERKFRYAPATGSSGNGQCGNNWPGGFCAATLPSPAVYDFYLMRTGDFGKGGASTDNPYPHFAMLNAMKGVIVDTAHSTYSVNMPYNNATSSGVLVNLTPVPGLAGRGNATVYGAVTAANFFRQADYDACGGNFDNFVKFLPVVSLYDDNGVFKAAGIVVPPPAFIATHDADFNLAFAKGYQAMKTLLASAGGFGYEIRGLAPNTCYTEVITTPNYPHYQRRVCAGGNGSRTALSVNLDDAVGAGAMVYGTVQIDDGGPYRPAQNASVVLAMDGSVDRSAATDSSGHFRFEGVPPGLAKLTASMSGFATVIDEESITTAVSSYPVLVTLSSAPGSVNGTVYSQKLPFTKVQAGAQIVAYDDQYNHDHPTLPLPLLKTVTGPDGTYTLNGLVTGDVYKLFLNVTGKYTLVSTFTATSGLVSGMDFTMLPKPLDVDVFAADNPAAGTYDFTIMNPQDFSGGRIYYGLNPYSTPIAEITTLFNKVSSGELKASIARAGLVDNAVYVLHIDATSLSNKTITKEILFGKNYNNSQQTIDDLMLGDDSDNGTGRKNNEAALDKSGNDPSSLVLPAGALITSSAAVVPACSLTAENKGSVAVSTKVAAADTGASVASNLYTVALSSVAQTDRSVELTLAYDKTITDTSKLTVKQYNDSTGKWEDASAIPASINPIKGTVTVKLKKLASVLSRRAGPQAVFDGHQYVVRTAASGGGTTASGTYAVMNYLGGALADPNGKLKVFNYPNPFNLKTKNMSNNHGAATMPATTYGTMIHVEVPAGNDGPCHIRIYTLGGELVKDISDTCTGGKYNYFGWDGRNKDGQEVANGVYYGVVDLSGSKPDRKDATFKMAVIK